MLTLITGQPGNGKTLYTLGVVEKLRQESGRPVFQSGIPELVLPWQDLPDPEKWFDCPPGSIIVIDECQRIFPPRKQGAAVPDKVAQFETHRHLGFDVYLITQHPQLLDIAVRKLVGRHFHVVRTFGRETAKIKQWERCVDPHDRSAQKEALETRFNFPKERFGQYRSAEIHTVKKDFPWKPVLVLAGAIIGVIALFGSAFWKVTDKPRERFEEAAVDLAGEAAPVTEGPRSHWEADSHEPRVEHWPWSAPFYDRSAKLQSVPRIIGCMSMRIGNTHQCNCHNGQGVANVSESVCRDFMEGRVFDPTRPASDLKAENIARLEAANGYAQPGASESSSVENRL